MLDDLRIKRAVDLSLIADAVRMANGKPVVVPGRPGVTVREKRLATVFLDLAGTRGGAREATAGEKRTTTDSIGWSLMTSQARASSSVGASRS